MLMAILCIDYCYVCFTHRNMGGVDVSDGLIGTTQCCRKLESGTTLFTTTF